MTGVNLAMAKSPAGQALDFVSIMAYLAGDKASTGFDWAESYRAHRAYWPTQVGRASGWWQAHHMCCAVGSICRGLGTWVLCWYSLVHAFRCTAAMW